MKWKLNCQETAILASQGLDSSISWWERLLIKVHLWMCHVCPEYIRQLKILHQVFKKITPPQETDTSIELSAEAKQRIQEALLKA